MTYGRRVFDFGIGFAVGPSAVETSSTLAWQSQLPSSRQAKEGDSHEKSPRCSAPKEDPGDSHEAASPRFAKLVGDIFRSYGLPSWGWSFCSAI
jgi:hypothetical protein